MRPAAMRPVVSRPVTPRSAMRPAPLAVLALLAGSAPLAAPRAARAQAPRPAPPAGPAGAAGGAARAAHYAGAAGAPAPNPSAAPRVPAFDPTDAPAAPADGPARRSVPVTTSGTAAPATPATPAAPGAPPVVSRRNAALTARERRAVGLSQRWMAGRDMPAVGADGRVVFTFGATLPSVVCAPLYVCDIALQPGEVVNDVNLADPVRWTLSPSASGSGAFKTTHLVLKPTDAGLTTNMLVTTDRRAYVIKLVSRQSDWMPFVSFVYPDEVNGQWAAYRAQQDAERARARAASVLPTGERGEANVAALNFDFRLEGDAPRWRPLRVYSDGARTYVQLPPAVASGEAPALVALGADGKEQLVNYRMVGDRYVVDRVLDRALLVAGVGKHQQRVEIVRGGGR